MERERNCRSCTSDEMKAILDLGMQPLANGILTKEQTEIPEPKFPLTLMFCTNCALVQIAETVSPDAMFSDYPYFSSFSDTMVNHARNLVKRLAGEFALNSNSKVIEVASNDGYLLQFYKEAGIPVLGIEPAKNVADYAEKEKGIPTLVEFFNRACAARLSDEGESADVIHAHNVFAHVPDPNDFTAGLKEVLRDDGVAVIEAPYLRDMVRNLEFDTIYHEHFSYYSLTAVDSLVRRHGLMVSDVEEVPIHGGTLRYFVRHEGRSVSKNVQRLLEAEKAQGLDTVDYFATFDKRVWRLRDVLVQLLEDLIGAGKSIAAYGASAKGATLLNAFGIGRDKLRFIADRSTVKQGRFAPGTHIPIVSPDTLVFEKPDYVLLLTWNFAEEILLQQRQYHENGGRFIIPVPSVRIV